MSKRAKTSFLKQAFPWLGNKQTMIQDVLAEFPSNDQFENYLEPFLGSGVVLANWLLINKDSHKKFFRKVRASDINPYVISTHRNIKLDCENLIKQTNRIWQGVVKHSTSSVDKSKYVETLIKEFNQLPHKGNTYASALFIVLSKCSFNSYVPIDQKGHVSQMDYTIHSAVYPDRLEPKHDEIDGDNLREISELYRLFNVKFYCLDWNESISTAKPNTFFVLDPPYHATGDNMYRTTFDDNAFMRYVKEYIPKTDVFILFNDPKIAPMFDGIQGFKQHFIFYEKKRKDLVVKNY
jgi:site-specific DNA-adenine methylase